MDSILLIRWHLNAEVTNAHHFSTFELLSSLKDMIVVDNPLNYNNVRGGKNKVLAWDISFQLFSMVSLPEILQKPQSHSFDTYVKQAFLFHAGQSPASTLVHEKHNLQCGFSGSLSGHL